MFILIAGDLFYIARHLLLCYTRDMSEKLEKFLKVIEFLHRDKDAGCPWLSEQTSQTIRKNMIEECYEAVEAIDSGDESKLKDELGDVLLQVILHAEMADNFEFDDVVEAISGKIHRRYPTILGDEPNTLRTKEEVIRRWREVKAEENKGQEPKDSILDDVPSGLPALLRAAKIKDRMGTNGWDWKDTRQIFDKIDEELSELREEVLIDAPDRERVMAEIGDVMFLLADLARWFKLDAEEALRQCLVRFEGRFRHMEAGLKAAGDDFFTSSSDQRNTLWNEAKALEKKSA